MEQIEDAQRLVSDPLQDQEAGNSIWTTFCNIFHTWKDYLLQLIQGQQYARWAPLDYSLEIYRKMIGWDEAYIRCIILHPTSVQMAVVTHKDVVHVFGVGPTAELQSAEQVDLYCGAFRPCTIRELAVGCAAGIYIWRHVSNTLWDKRLLRHAAHIHVTSVQWNEDGTVLVSVALGSHHIIVWEPESGQTIRLLPSSISFLLYSPDFQMIFGAASDSGASVCYVDRRSWKLEQILEGRRVQTAAWTACSTYLLFVQKNDTNLYAITRNSEVGVFLKPQLFWAFELVANLQTTPFAGQELCRSQPQAIAVDPSNVYLAVIYKKQPFVGLFKLCMARHKKLSILATKYIYSDDNQTLRTGIFPTCMCFEHGQNDKRNLAIAWTSGHVQCKNL
ncbi:aladin [Drosophila miranda]|uniref:aladin n=1 Tax=Drosophila miranda TaxID=7229 RepID=UPI0007E7F3A1|nr:aladin [Drosophila miranda]